MISAKGEIPLTISPTKELQPSVFGQPCNPKPASKQKQLKGLHPGPSGPFGLWKRPSPSPELEVDTKLWL